MPEKQHSEVRGESEEWCLSSDFANTAQSGSSYIDLHFDAIFPQKSFPIAKVLVWCPQSLGLNHSGLETLESLPVFLNNNIISMRVEMVFVLFTAVFLRPHVGPRKVQVLKIRGCTCSYVLQD